ncbi:MAG: ImmA/IrrE family metallo-endopeptidase, partial [Chloroflexales bacterium]|nr:ImmA/IrrE family metallo-endopeptidase [Chloroflexales bacterium]
MSIRHQHIRARAAALRARYAESTGQPAPALLPLDELAELLLLSAFDDPTLAAGINGELNPQIGAIRLRPGLYPTRRRFVLAHELGHFALEDGAQLFEDDDATIDELVGADDQAEAGVLRAYNTRERAEREANMFALELLIPADDLLTQLQLPAWGVQRLAERYGVSPDSLRTQLVNVCCLEPGGRAAEPQNRRTAELQNRRTENREQKTAEPQPPSPSFSAGNAGTAAPPPPAPSFQPPDAHQQAAVDAPLPVLVAAGPG